MKIKSYGVFNHLLFPFFLVGQLEPLQPPEAVCALQQLIAAVQ